MSSGSGTTSSQSSRPAATISSLSTALGWSGAVTQIAPSRMTPAASAADRSSERLTPSGPMDVTTQTGMWASASARPASGSSTTARRQPAAPKQIAAAASSAAARGRGLRLLSCSAAVQSSPASTGFPLMRMRWASGSQPAWYRPVTKPAALSTAAMRAADAVLPAVPAAPTYATCCAAAGRAARSSSAGANPSGRAAKYSFA